MNTKCRKCEHTRSRSDIVTKKNWRGYWRESVSPSPRFYRGVAALELGRGVPLPVPPVLGPGVAAPVLDVDTRGVPRGVPRLEPGRGVRGAGALVLPVGCACPFETFGSAGGSAGLVAGPA